MSQSPLHPSLRMAKPLVALASALALAPLGGCASQSQLVKLLGSEELPAYTKTCAAAATEQARRLREGEYNPVRLAVRAWEGGSPEPTITEASLLAALQSGELRRTVIYARGGLGKSTLADSLRAQLCGTTPAFVVDLKTVAEQDPPSAEVIRAAIAAGAGLTGKGEQEKALNDALATSRFVLFADHIEETPQVRRAKTMAALLDFAQGYPLAQVVLLARPPVLDNDYGFAAKVELEIPPLDTKAADAEIAKQFKAEDERAGFQQLLSRYGLNEKATYGAQSIYPYLATYRDIHAIAEFYRNTKSGGMLVSPSAVYQSLISARLRKEFDDLRWTQEDALDMGDRLVRVASGSANQRNLSFDMELCEKSIHPRWGEAAVDAGVAGDASERKRHVCEKTFQSAMFRQGEGPRQFVFADRSTTDLFHARWLNNEVTRSATPDCAVLAKYADLVTNVSVAKFLVGQPWGSRCLAQVIAEGCAHQNAAEMTKAIDLGLPIGKDRVKILQDARAASSALQPAMCIKEMLDNLDQTVGETP